jgi:hypothetical protein
MSHLEGLGPAGRRGRGGHARGVLRACARGWGGVGQVWWGQCQEHYLG